jgi:hypothetical protein
MEGYPSFKFAPDHRTQHLDAGSAVVEAGEIGEVGSPGFDERLATADCELFQGLEAIGGEAGGEDRNLADALAGELRELGVGGGGEPFGSAEAGLEGDHQVTAHGFAEEAGGLAAMAMIGVPELQRPLRHSVEACDHRLRLEVERGEAFLDHRLQRLDVEPVLIIRRKSSDGGLPAQLSQMSEGFVIGVAVVAAQYWG